MSTNDVTRQRLLGNSKHTRTRTYLMLWILAYTVASAVYKVYQSFTWTEVASPVRPGDLTSIGDQVTDWLDLIWLIDWLSGWRVCLTFRLLLLAYNDVMLRQMVASKDSSSLLMIYTHVQRSRPELSINHVIAHVTPMCHWVQGDLNYMMC